MKARFILLAIAVCTAILSFLSSSAGLWMTAAAAGLYQNLAPRVDYVFGKQVTFSLDLPAEGGFQSVQLFFREKGSTNTQNAVMQVNNQQASYSINPSDHRLLAFHEVEYWFGLTDADGKQQTTPVFSFLYDDNRFEWQSLEDAPFQVHWYIGDLKFGQSVLDVARAGLENARTLIKFPDPQNIKIYVYASGQDLQSSLQLAAVNLIAGHADPSLGVMIVSLPEGPSQRMEIGRQVPHELMHILLYQKLGVHYASIPTWLNEGISSNNEELPNADYYVVLDDAARKNSLLPLANLCNGFPLDAASFYQSYAQSTAFVYYLYQKYGLSKIDGLLEQYGDGVGCVNAPVDVMGADLNSLEKQWQAEMAGVSSSNPAGQAVPIFPWLIVLILLLSGPFVLTILQFFRPKNL